MCSTRVWYVITGVTLAFSLILFLGVAVITGMCSASKPMTDCIYPSDKSNLTQSYDITSTLGISMEILMIFCTLRLYSLSHSNNFTSEFHVLAFWFKIMRTQSWARNRLCLLIAVLGYLLLLVGISVNDDQRFPAIKNAVVALQAIFLYMLLLVSNLHGPLGRFHPVRGVDTPSRHVTYLSFILFTFAAVIDLLHFAGITMVEAMEDWGQDSDTDFGFFRILGLTAHIALRLDYAKYFWEMANVGFSDRLGIYGGENTVLTDIAADWIKPGRQSQSSDTDVTSVDEHGTGSPTIEGQPLLQRHQDTQSLYGSRESSPPVKI